SPSGFRATGVSAGLKEIRARDLALILSQTPCRAAALFTTNSITAAPVYFDQVILARNREGIRALLINTVHANAGTGQPGLQSPVECAKIVADELEVPRDSVLQLSAGQIGVPLPMDKMRAGIRRAASELDSSGGRRAAIAMLTGEARPKDRAIRATLRAGRSAVLAGMARGGRALQPQSATLLAAPTTDAPVEARPLPHPVEQSAPKAFGRLAICGEASPNDAIVLLANGSAGGPLVGDLNSYEFGAFQEALDYLCSDLAQQIARESAAS